MRSEASSEESLSDIDHFPSCEERAATWPSSAAKPRTRTRPGAKLAVALRACQAYSPKPRVRSPNPARRFDARVRRSVCFVVTYRLPCGEQGRHRGPFLDLRSGAAEACLERIDPIPIRHGPVHETYGFRLAAAIRPGEPRDPDPDVRSEYMAGPFSHRLGHLTADGAHLSQERLWNTEHGDFDAVVVGHDGALEVRAAAGDAGEELARAAAGAGFGQSDRQAAGLQESPEYLFQRSTRGAVDGRCEEFVHFGPSRFCATSGAGFVLCFCPGEDLDGHAARRRSVPEGNVVLLFDAGEALADLALRHACCSQVQDDPGFVRSWQARSDLALEHGLHLGRHARQEEGGGSTDRHVKAWCAADGIVQDDGAARNVGLLFVVRAELPSTPTKSRFQHRPGGSIHDQRHSEYPSHTSRGAIVGRWTEATRTNDDFRRLPESPERGLDALVVVIDRCNLSDLVTDLGQTLGKPGRVAVLDLTAREFRPQTQDCDAHANPFLSSARPRLSLGCIRTTKAGLCRDVRRSFSPRLEVRGQDGRKRSPAKAGAAVFFSGPLGDVAGEVQDAVGCLSFRTNARQIWPVRAPAAGPIDATVGGAPADQAVRPPRKAPTLDTRGRIDPFRRRWQAPAREGTEGLRSLGVDPADWEPRFCIRTAWGAHAGTGTLRVALLRDFGVIEQKATNRYDATRAHARSVPIRRTKQHAATRDGDLLRHDRAARRFAGDEACARWAKGWRSKAAAGISSLAWCTTTSSFREEAILAGIGIAASAHADERSPRDERDASDERGQAKATHAGIGDERTSHDASCGPTLEASLSGASCPPAKRPSRSASEMTCVPTFLAATSLL